MQILIRDRVVAEADVVFDGAGEEERVLQDDGKVPAQGGEVMFAEVDAVEENLAAVTS